MAPQIMVVGHNVGVPVSMIRHDIGVPIDGYPAPVGSGSMVEVRDVGFRWDSCSGSGSAHTSQCGASLHLRVVGSIELIVR